MRQFAASILVLCVSTSVLAHHPDRENQPVRPRIEVIPPLGTNLRMSHRRKYNRPTYWGGKIAYHVAPSSQEAMTWHRATHRGYYENDSPRIVTHYFYAKPWESIQIGPRPRPEENDEDIDPMDQGVSPSDIAPGEAEPGDVLSDDSMALPLDRPLSDRIELIEE